MALEFGAQRSENAQSVMAREISGEMHETRFAGARRPLEDHDAAAALAGIPQLLLDGRALCLALDEQLNVPVVATSASSHVSGMGL
jgi:hypothetical protein